MEDEVSFVLGLINCRRSRRGDWDSSIIEASHLHLTVPACLERATWAAEASTLTLTVNFAPVAATLPDLHDLAFFLPAADETVYCYASNDDASEAATSAVAILNDKLSTPFLALQFVHAVEQAVLDVRADAGDDDERRAKAIARVAARLASQPDTCDVMLCLLATAATSPNRLSPPPPMFKRHTGEINLAALKETLSEVPSIPELQRANLDDILSNDDDLRASLALLDWVWCRLPVSLSLVTKDALPASLCLEKGELDIALVAKVHQSRDPWFDDMAAQHGVAQCFHGSKLAHFHSILQNGLHVMSGTRHMSSGNVFGDGIYFAQSAQVAMNFAYGTPSQQWTPSGVLSQDAICVAVCLVLRDRDRLTTLPGATPDAKYYVLTDQRGVRVEYLVFLEPKARSAMRVLLGSPWDVAISLFWFAVAYGLYRLCDATS